MSSSLRRGALAAAAIAFSIASLSACAAGHNAQTLQIQPDNAATTVGDIKIQNAIVVTQPDLESTGPAVVSATLFNEGDTDQTLESVTVPGTGKTAELSPAEGGSLTVPAGGRLILGGEGNASAVLPSSREAVRDGNAQQVTFTFSETGDVSLRAFVFPAENFFESWGPSEIPAAPGASAETSTEPSAESSEEPAAGSTDEATGTPGDTETSGAPDTEVPSGTPSDAASASQPATH
ncbi:lipoprotein [Streptomyces malachitofuscus]|nr:lipoprotein [Streptomyces malachitofuscus]